MSGLRERIRHAGSLVELEEALAEGTSYEHVSRTTQRRWFVAYNKRRTELLKSKDSIHAKSSKSR